MISVIIPTYNAEKHIGNLLKTLTEQTVYPFEIIVVDSSSTDKTVEIVKNYPVKLISINKEEFDHGKTRTLAGKKARGDTLVYLTHDAILVNNNSIENLIKPLIKDKEIGAAYGRQIPYENTNIFGKHLRYFNYPEKSIIKSLKDKEKYGFKVAFLSNSFAAYRKDVLEEVGWFPENTIFGEDTIAAAKILLKGYKIAYSADATVYHSHSYSLLEEFKRYFDIGVFHSNESWLLKTFGKPEGEGLKYIKSEIKFLISRRKYHKIPEWFTRNLLKYLGYKLGSNYEKIHVRLIEKFTMNKSWWNKKEENRK